MQTTLKNWSSSKIELGVYHIKLPHHPRQNLEVGAGAERQSKLKKKNKKKEKLGRDLGPHTMVVGLGSQGETSESMHHRCKRLG